MKSRVSITWLRKRALGMVLIIATVLVPLLSPGLDVAGAHAPDLAPPQAVQQDGSNPHQPVSNGTAAGQSAVTLAADAPGGDGRALADLRSTEAVYPPDTRTRVSSPSGLSWRWNVYLEAYWPLYYVTCTGFLVGPHTVITAGHCLYQPGDGWADDVRVVPARNGNSEPFGYQWSNNLWSVTGWTVDSDSNYDYGAVILPNDTMGNAVGTFMPYGYFSTDFLFYDIGTLGISGYPGDKLFQGLYGTTLWVARGRRLVSADDYMAYYQVDTEYGQSGSAVWTTYKGNRFAIAIHTQGYCGWYENCGVRISQPVAGNIQSWGGAPPLSNLLPGPVLLAPPDNLLTRAPVTFLWQSTPAAAKYELELYKWVCSSLECTWRVIWRRIGATPTVTRNLATGYYWWHVRSIQPNQVPGQWGEWRWLEVDKKRPSRPIPWYPPKGDILTDTTPELDWGWATGDTDINVFEVQLSQNATFSTVPVGTVTPNNWFIVPSPLSPGRWYWRVRAYDYAGNVGPWSPVWNFTIVTVTSVPESQPGPPIIIVTPEPIVAPVVPPPSDKLIPPDDVISVGPLPGEPAPVAPPDGPPVVTPAPAPVDPVEPPPVDLPPVEPPTHPDPGGMPPGDKPAPAQ